MSKVWKDVWLDNYNGTSDAHKDLEKLMKKNYKGHQYIPWAVMVKWLYLMDPDAELIVHQDEHGSPVITSEGEIESYSRVVGKDSETTKSTTVPYKAHFVKLTCKFLGVTFNELYPIQDSAYNAPSYYDSNMVNKSIQRAKAKVISIATGLAFSLYENGDLQFEDDNIQTKDEKVVVKKTVEAPKQVKEELTEKKEDIMKDDIKDVVDFIKTKPDIDKVLQALNVDIIKTYGFQLSPIDDDLESKVAQLKNPKIFGRALKKRYEDMLNAK